MSWTHGSMWPVLSMSWRSNGSPLGSSKDYAAVRAAVELPWSNGQIEDQVNRHKLIKRVMYGRARFDLLRLRVLSAA